MSSTALLHSLMRLLALTVLPSALVAWGAADQLSGEADQRFQITAVEECLSLATRVDDSDPDDAADDAPFQHPPRYLTTGLQIPAPVSTFPGHASPVIPDYPGPLRPDA